MPVPPPAVEPPAVDPRSRVEPTPAVEAGTIEIRISGRGLNPATLPWRDLLAVLTLAAEAVEAVAEAAGNRPEETRLSLTGVRPGSVVPCLVVSPAAERAARRYAESLTRDRFASLPLRARQRTRSLQQKVEKEGWDAVTFAAPDLPAVPLRADSDLPDRLFYSGRTTLHALCLRAGGRGRRASATLQLPNQRTIRARVASERLIKEIRPYILERISVIGSGTWDAVTHEMTAFLVEGLEANQPVASPDPAADMRRKLRAIAEASSGWWREVEPAEFVRDLRQED